MYYHYDQVSSIDPGATHPALIALFKILRIMIQVEDANVQEAGGSSTFWKEARQVRVFNPHLPPPHHHHCLHPHLSQQVADEDVQARSRDEPRVPRKPTQVNFDGDDDFDDDCDDYRNEQHKKMKEKGQFI